MYTIKTDTSGIYELIWGSSIMKQGSQSCSTQLISWPAHLQQRCGVNLKVCGGAIMWRMRCHGVHVNYGAVQLVLQEVIS